jgi:co-chaperonin GroES (HSP10)
MTPLHQWVAVKPLSMIPAAYIWVPEKQNGGSCRLGEVIAIGRGRQMGGWDRPMPVAPGQRILYSSRVDLYHVNGDKIDVIEDESIIGVMHDDRH